RSSLATVPSSEPSSDTIKIQFLCVCPAIDLNWSSINAAPFLVHIKIATRASGPLPSGTLAVPLFFGYMFYMSLLNHVGGRSDKARRHQKRTRSATLECLIELPTG